MRYIVRKYRMLGLMLAGAWLPATLTCSPSDVIHIVDGGYWGAPVVVEEYPADVVVVDDGPYVADDGWGFDFGFWH